MSDNQLHRILGVKVKQKRTEMGLSLKALSQQCGLSPSYLNEIEKGKKYPKPDKLELLADALQMDYDELVSRKLEDRFNSFSNVLDAPLLKKFPFHIFGIKPQSVIDLMAEDPEKTGVLVQLLTDLGQTYDMRVEHFYHTALRTQQVLANNYFEDLEKAARKFRKSLGWTENHCPDHRELKQVLQERFGVMIDSSEDAEFKDFRSIMIGKKKTLFVNPKLNERQQGFVFAREIAYHQLSLSERAYSSPALEVVSFEEVSNNFKASYFADALIIPEQGLKAELKALFKQTRWNPQAFMELFHTYHATPEMLFYRMSEILPKHLKTERIHFLKFSRQRAMKSATDSGVHMMKHLNMSRVHIPQGIGLKEHFCRQWLSIEVLNEFEKSGGQKPVINVQKSRFIGHDSQFFCIAIAYANSMDPDKISSVTIGFKMDADFRRTVKCWNDPSVENRILGQTCERCPLSEAECNKRVAQPTIHQKQIHRDQLKQVLSKTLEA